MVHDLDILLEFVKDPVVAHRGRSASRCSPAREDMADARITFADGCVADLRASRISMKKMRKIRFFQRTAYVSIDYDARRVVGLPPQQGRRGRHDRPVASSTRATLEDPQGFVFSKLLEIEEFAMDQGEDALTAELGSFIEACRGEHAPVVPGEHGLRAVEVALEIQREIAAYVDARGEARRHEAPRHGPRPHGRSGSQRRGDGRGLSQEPGQQCFERDDAERAEPERDPREVARDPGERPREQRKNANRRIDLLPDRGELLADPDVAERRQDGCKEAGEDERFAERSIIASLDTRTRDPSRTLQ